MLVVISPAKRLDWSEFPAPVTEPAFAEDAVALAGVARQLDVAALRKLMTLSEDLGRLNRDRFAAFVPDPAPDATRPAAMAFAGDTYQGLEARTLDEDALRWAQGHLRILSGLYGLLRPLDRIQPYRLEMGIRLANPKGKTLYDYWGPRLAEALNDAARAAGADTLINCASVEYFRAVDRAALRLRVVTPMFMEVRNGTQSVISFHAKKARGAMARFVMENRIVEPGDLRDFDSGGYRFDPDQSEPDQPVFLRDGT